MSTSNVDSSIVSSQAQNAQSTPGSTSLQHKKNSKSQNPNQVLKHIKYNTGQIKKIAQPATQYSSIGNSDTQKQLTEMSNNTVKQQPTTELSSSQHLTSQNPSHKTTTSGSEGLTNMVIASAQGSNNLNSSIKKGVSGANSSKGGANIRSSTNRSSGVPGAGDTKGSSSS